MSQFLAPYFLDIPLGYTIVQMQNRFVGHLTANGWQLLAQVDGDHSDLIPPATETIGTTQFREVVRIYFPNNTTLTIGSYQVCIADAFPQQVRVVALTPGAVQAAVTIGGVQVLGAIGTSGSSANDNLRALFYALKDSADPTITGWDYWYNGTDTLIATNKTIAAVVAVTGSNVTCTALSSPVRAGARSGYVNVDASIGYSIPVDLTNGFVYYMDVYSRSFNLGTKCLSGVSGEIFASYADHAEALAAMPAGASLCTPIELIVGKSNEASANAYGRPTHWWILPTAYANRTVPATETVYLYGAYDAPGDAHPFTGMLLPKTLMDGGISYRNGIGTNYGDEVKFSELYEAADTSSGGSTPAAAGQYKVVSVGTSNKVVAGSSAYSQSDRFLPAINLPDVHKWNGTEPNEASAMATLVSPPGLNGVGLTLQQAMDDTSAYPTLLFSSVEGLNAAGGGFTIGAEGFTYTGLSGGNTATGVARAQNGTTAARHFVNDVVQPTMWFLKVNNSAVCCGATAPV